MKIHDSHDPLRDPVSLVLEGLEPELERLLVGDALVERKGLHYRIVSGAESWEELEILSRGQLRPPGAIRS